MEKWFYMYFQGELNRFRGTNKISSFMQTFGSLEAFLRKFNKEIVNYRGGASSTDF